MAIEITKIYTDGESKLDLLKIGKELIITLTQNDIEMYPIQIKLDEHDLEELITDLRKYLINIKNIKING